LWKKKPKFPKELVGQIGGLELKRPTGLGIKGKKVFLIVGLEHIPE